MILKDEVKYSCVECIRGHRSSLCKHHQRPLLQVRAKGRPNIQNNPNYRLAIFAKQVETLDNNIHILKSSIEYIVDFKTNDIVGPYTESSQIVRLLREIDSNSFINATSCCSKGMSKNHSCGCNHSNNHTKILKRYLTKNKRKFTFINNNDEARRESLRDQLDRSLKEKELEVNPCYCGEDCECEGCLIHRNRFDINAEFELAMKLMEPSEVKSYVPKFDHLLNLTVNDLNNNLFSSQVAFDTNGYAQPVLNGDLPNGECLCADDACKCTNCETHGIINGIKLDDIFGSVDLRLMNLYL